MSIITGSIALAYATTNAARVMHARLIRCILRVPMTFFDTTPLGRVMNRCSKDIDTLDVQIPFMVRGFLYFTIPLIAIIFVVSYSTPIFLAVVFPMAVIYLFFQVCILKLKIMCTMFCTLLFLVSKCTCAPYDSYDVLIP